MITRTWPKTSAIELSREMEIELGEKATTVAKMTRIGKDADQIRCALLVKK